MEKHNTFTINHYYYNYYYIAKIPTIMPKPVHYNVMTIKILFACTVSYIAILLMTMNYMHHVHLQTGRILNKKNQCMHQRYNIAKWMVSTCLKFNQMKSEFFWCVTFHCLHFINRSTFIKQWHHPSLVVRNLAAYFAEVMWISLSFYQLRLIWAVINSNIYGNTTCQQFCYVADLLLYVVHPSRWLPILQVGSYTIYSQLCSADNLQPEKVWRPCCYWKTNVISFRFLLEHKANTVY